MDAQHPNPTLHFFHPFLKSIHIPLRARNQVLFIEGAHDLHEKCLECIFRFRDPQRLILPLFAK
jgi:hypothetical protein